MVNDDTAEKVDEEERKLQEEIDQRVAKATKKRGLSKEEVKHAQKSRQDKKQVRKRRTIKQQLPKQKTALEEKNPIHVIEEKPEEELEESHGAKNLVGKLRTALEEIKEEDSMDNESMIVLSNNNIPNVTMEKSMDATMLDVTAEDAMISKPVHSFDDPMGFFYAPEVDESSYIDNLDEDDQCSDPELEKNIISQLNIVDKEVYRTNYKDMKKLDKMAENYKNLLEEYRSNGSVAIKEEESFAKGDSQITAPADRLW